MEFLDIRSSSLFKFTLRPYDVDVFYEMDVFDGFNDKGIIFHRKEKQS